MKLNDRPLAFAAPIALRTAISLPTALSPFRPPLPLRRVSQSHPRHRRVATTALALSPPIKTPAAAKSFALTQWLMDNGMELSPEASWGAPRHPMTIAEETKEDGEPCGRGLIAVKPILQGETLFEVPFSVVMTKDAALRQFPEFSDDVNEYVAIATLLISEREKGPDSFWAPYLDVLPSDEELIPLFRWPDEDVEVLKGSPVVPAAQSLRLKLAREFATAEEDFFARDRTRFPEDVFTLDNWEWAFAVLFSRAIMLSAERRIALVPYADLLNHNPFCSTYIDVQKPFLSEDRFVTLYTDRPYAITDQVFVTYGPKSNADLLLLYGFVTDRNPYDSVELLVSIDENDALYERKRDYLRESGMTDSTVNFPLYRDRYPMELVEFLRFGVANEEEFETADFGAFINERNETLVARAIIAACRAALANYPTTREEDDKLIGDYAMFQMLDQKMRWGIRQRRAEKRILERTISSIEQEMMEPRFMFTESKE